MTLWFYGDSWPAGCELGDMGASCPDLSFPGLVGKKLKVPIHNLAMTGSSQPYMIEAVMQSSPAPGDVLIFCCTAKTRRMYRDAHNNIVEMQFNPDDRFVNPYEDERVSAQTCLLLYFLAKELNTVPYFLNLFDCPRFGHPLEKIIPENNWLIPPTESVLSFLFDPVFFHRFQDHHNGDFREWLDRNCDLVKKYIRPYQAHPNPIGHDVIAEHIANTLKQKGHFKHAPQ